MDKIDLDELERLATQATLLPWHTIHGEILDAYHLKRAFMSYEEASKQNAAYIVAACNAVPSLIARVRDLERERELYRERLHESWNQTEYCIDLLHDAGVNLTMWACGVESCQQCDVPECDMGDLDMVEKYTSRKAEEQAAKEAGE